MAGGVAAGLAIHFGIDVFWVRLAFVIGTWVNGFGVLVYIALWRLLPQGDPDDATQPAGLASATRRGLRTPGRTSRLPGGDIGQTLALIVLGLGVLLLQEQLGWGLASGLLWPLMIAVAGLALLWRQADEAQRQRWAGTSPDVPILGLLLGGGGWAAVIRLGLGAVLLATAVGFFVAQSQGAEALGSVAIATVLALLGLGLLLGPWIHRLSRDLAAERRERVRSQERADMAAHLHDSVLQTLALLQRHSGDARTVAKLARRQERELREWLYADSSPSGETLRAALTAVANEVEDMHDVTVEVVGVGEVPMDDTLAAMVRAAREAMVNAAKHSGADHVDVYAETAGPKVEVFVRDRGAGFDPDAIPDGRLGVRESILGRMQRHGGSASIRSGPGEGTEVRLSMTLQERDEESAR
jgi:signal transduction histidine kinase/phage shock protein PspC (stress-responsive transcriptional regulator)